MDGTYCLPCIPLVAVYGAAYCPCFPIAVLQLPHAEEYRRGVLPRDMVQELEKDGWGACDVDIYAVVHSTPMRQECQKFICRLVKIARMVLSDQLRNSNMNEVNMMYHCW